MVISRSMIIWWSRLTNVGWKVWRDFSMQSTRRTMLHPWRWKSIQKWFSLQRSGEESQTGRNMKLGKSTDVKCVKVGLIMINKVHGFLNVLQCILNFLHVSFSLHFFLQVSFLFFYYSQLSSRKLSGTDPLPPVWWKKKSGNKNSELVLILLGVLFSVINWRFKVPVHFNELIV